MGAVVASLSESKYETGIKLDHVQALSGYWQQIRLLYVTLLRLLDVCSHVSPQAMFRSKSQ